MNLQSIEFGFIVKLLSGNQYIDFNRTKIEKTMFTDAIARNLYSFIGKQISSIGGFTPQLHLPIFLNIEGMENLYNQFKDINNYNFEYNLDGFSTYLQSFVDNEKELSYFENAISEEYTRREMKNMSEEMLEMSDDRKKTSMELLRKVSVKLDNLLYKGNDDIEDCSTDDIFEQEFEYATDGIPDKYVPTGLSIIDDETGGLTSPSTVFILANPKNGKSTSLYDITVFNLKQGRTILFATIETNAQETRRKILSSYTGIEYKKIQNKTYTEQEKQIYLEGLKDFHSKFKDKFFLIYNKNGMSCKDIEIHWNNCKKSGIKCQDIMIDQLVLLQPNDKNMSMVEGMVKKPQEVRILSQKTDTRIFSPSQLKNEVIGKDITKINTDDIWFAKTISQEATAIVVLHLDGHDLETGHLKMKSLPSRCGYSNEIYHFPNVNFNKMTLGKAEVWTNSEKMI